MTPDEEAQFIELWKAGAPYLHIAEMMKIPTGTVGTRARALQQRGLIQARARGGSKRQPARRDPESPQGPAPPAPAPPAPAPPAVTFVAVPEIHEILSIVKDLQARVGSLEQTRVPPALPAPPAANAPPATPAPPVPPVAERKDIQQWTVRLSRALIEHLKAVAYERRVPPSHLLEELAWHALKDQSS